MSNKTGWLKWEGKPFESNIKFVEDPDGQFKLDTMRESYIQIGMRDEWWLADGSISRIPPDSEESDETGDQK